MNPRMQAGTSHVSGSIHIIDSGSTNCNTDRWNFIDLAYKYRPSRCRLPSRNRRYSESIPFPFIDQGGAMNAGSIFAILILTMEVAYTCRGAERQAHITLNIRCDYLGPNMTIMVLVHSMYNMRYTRHVNQRQFKEDIPIKGRRKELHPLDDKSVKIKCLKNIFNSLYSPNPLQGIYNTKTLLRQGAADDLAEKETFDLTLEEGY